MTRPRRGWRRPPMRMNDPRYPAPALRRGCSGQEVRRWLRLGTACATLGHATSTAPDLGPVGWSPVAILLAFSPPPVRLTGRENDVLVRLPYYASRAEIADDVGISLNTVKTHLRSIYGKLGVRSRAEAVDRARELALLG